MCLMTWDTSRPSVSTNINLLSTKLSAAKRASAFFFFLSLEKHIFVDWLGNKRIDKYWNTIKRCSCCKYWTIKTRKKLEEGAGTRGQIEWSPACFGYVGPGWVSHSVFQSFRNRIHILSHGFFLCPLQLSSDNSICHISLWHTPQHHVGWYEAALFPFHKKKKVEWRRNSVFPLVSSPFL